MALAQIINGTSEEIIRYLEQYQEKQNLTLIVPEETDLSSQNEANIVQRIPTSYPEDAEIFHGIHLLPVNGRSEIMTLEKVKELLEEDD